MTISIDKNENSVNVLRHLSETIKVDKHAINNDELLHSEGGTGTLYVNTGCKLGSLSCVQGINQLMISMQCDVFSPF